MSPKQFQPRFGKPGRPAGDQDRPRRPRPFEADRQQGGAKPARRGERPDWAPRGYNAEAGDRRRQARPQRAEDGRPNWEPRKPWSPTPERGAREDRGGRREWTPREGQDDRGMLRNPRSAEDRGRSFGASRERQHFDRTDRADRPERTDRAPREWAPREDRAPRREWTPREDRAPRDAERAPRRFDRDADRDFRPRFGDEQRPAFVPEEDVVLERLDAQEVAADAGEGLGFGDLGLGDNLVRQLAAMGAAQPFPIQAATIPEVLAGRDVLGRGRTGSGKTIAFGAPVVERLLRAQRGAKGRSMGRRPRAIILAPTRELAQQIDRTVQPLARAVGLFTIGIVGGVPYQKQLTGLQRGADIVIGTPGRILDLMSKGQLDLSEIAISVLDEADHMCDLGFLEPVQDILRETPEGSQRLLFSATLDTAVESLVAEFLQDPSVHEVAGEDQASSTITHKVWIVDASAKRDFVRDLAGGAERSIVFARTRAFAEELAELLDDSGIRAASLHGDLNQSRRNRSLQALTRGEVRSLVATDVAARGIHVDDVELVIQADMPDDHKTYLHRAGRTGRAGALGTVITVIPPGRRRRMEDLLRNAGIEAEWEDRATTRRPDRDRPFREDRPYRDRADRPARPAYQDRPERKPRMSEQEFAEFQAWKAQRDAARTPAE